MFSILVQLEIKVFVSVEGGNLVTLPGEKPLEQAENQQQTQPTYDTGLESNPGYTGAK